MHLVKRLRVREMHWQQPNGCTLILDSLERGQEHRGEHWVSRELADSCGISLDQRLIGSELEYTLTHRMLTGRHVPITEPRHDTEPEARIGYSGAVYSLKPTTVLLSKIQRCEDWSWFPNMPYGYAPGEPLHHHTRYVLWVKTASEHRVYCGFPPSCSLTVELTPEEYDACTKLLPGSVFDLALRQIPALELVPA